MKLAIACSLLICLTVSLDTAQAQKYIDIEATMDRVRETEPELWRQHGGEEYDRQKAAERANNTVEWSFGEIAVLALFLLVFLGGYFGKNTKKE